MTVVTSGNIALAHVAVGANAISNALSGNSANAGAGALCQQRDDALVAAFAAKNAVALVARDATDPALLRTCATLQHRTAKSDAARITAVLLHATSAHIESSSNSNGDRVLAGDSEGSVFLWQRVRASQPWQLTTISSAGAQQLPLPKASVAAVAAAETRHRWLYFVSFSDGTLVAFEHRKLQSLSVGDTVETHDVREFARLDLGTRCILETLAATVVFDPDTSDTTNTDSASIVLAAGGVDSKVHLFEVAASSFTPLLALEGHRDWIRSVAFEAPLPATASSPDAASQSSLMLASASQDQRIRLWRVTATLRSTSDSFDASSSHRDAFSAAGERCDYSVRFDALLVGHDDWVTSVQWTLSSASMNASSMLVSASMDNALVVWQQSSEQNAWRPALRVGDMAGNGLLRGVVLPSVDNSSDSDRLELLALGFAGQLERWQQAPAPSSLFVPALAPTGHCAAVTDLSWSPAGDYVLSVSLDQTARVLAPLPQRTDKHAWLEVSRAQVHGYDLNCACFLLGGNGANDRFVSGADEKILRVFTAPDDLQTLVRRLAGGDATPASDDASSSNVTRVQHAYLPELSLTNKSAAAHDDSSDASAQVDASASSYVTLRTSTAADDATTTDASNVVRLPVGETLAKKTLWPEQRKLYGHGNELLCVASNHTGTLIASACKARDERTASVWLWDTRDWRNTQVPLDGHKSSVVQLAFAPSDALLLSVSRDRHVCVYERQAGDDSSDSNDRPFQLTARIAAHKRIIWSCAWSPDSRFFVTASRDQSVAVWRRAESADATAPTWCAASKPTLLESAVTAVAFAPAALSQQTQSTESDNAYTLAVGLESGAIALYRLKVLPDGDVASTRLLDVDAALAPAASVTRLAWSPAVAAAAIGTRILAAASSDHSVRLYTVQLPVVQ